MSRPYRRFARPRGRDELRRYVRPRTGVRGRGSRPELPDVMGRVDVRSADLEQIGSRAVAVNTGGLSRRRWRATSPVPAWSIESLWPR